jgi:hypothetical protein
LWLLVNWQSTASGVAARNRSLDEVHEKANYARAKSPNDETYSGELEADIVD